MHAVRIIGIGSAYGDDQVGLQAIEHLTRELSNKHPVSCLNCESPHQLFWLLAQAELVIVIDAVYTVQPLGTIYCWQAHQLKSLPKNEFSSHGVAVSQMWSLLQTLGCPPKQCLVYGIEIDPTRREYQTPLSDLVDSALSSVLQQIINIIKSHFKKMVCTLDKKI